jgi:type II secretory pathway pseudopilin PulG
MRRSLHGTAGFSLVEVTLALGVAALCLLVLLGLLPIGLKTQKSSIQQTTATQIVSSISAVLRADARLPPGQANKVCPPGTPDPNVPCNYGALHGHWAEAGHFETLYFTDGGYQTGSANNSSPDAVFRATVTYRSPPSETTGLATIRVTWPASLDPDDPALAGSVTTELAVSR